MKIEGATALVIGADQTSEIIKAALPEDLTALYPAIQAQWDTETADHS